MFLLTSTRLALHIWVTEYWPVLLLGIICTLAPSKPAFGTGGTRAAGASAQRIC